MKTTAALAALFAAAAQAAITFEQFPATGITCPNSDASGQLTSDTATLKAAAEAAKDGEPYEQSASNIASGQCSSLKLPYFIVSYISSLNLVTRKMKLTVARECRPPPTRPMASRRLA